MALLAVAPASAQAAQFWTEGVGLAGTPGGALQDHANQFARDGLPSSCGDGMGQSSPIITPGVRRARKSFAFTSLIHEDACVTVTLSTMCAGGDAIFSASFSPSFDPEVINSNWIGDLGDNPPTFTSYSFQVAAGARFETVVSEQEPTANCGGVGVLWTSDRPWARSRPVPLGVPAIGRTLTRAINTWDTPPETVTTQWQRCDAAGNACTDISGATGTSYVVAADDLGHTLRMRETATEGGFTSTVDGEPTFIPVFLPVETHQNASLAAGDSATTGLLTTSNTPSRCAAPKGTPGSIQGSPRFYDTYGITSLVNEPACLWVSQPSCFTRTVVYSPQFVPADVTQNYVADDSMTSAQSFLLGPGAQAEVMVSDTFGAGCSMYELLIGSDGPFATARPNIDGAPVAGSPVATTNGSWPGAPAFAYAWLRCDAGGGGCAPIAGADGASYTPTRDDVGSRLRSRITATQGDRSLSSDSAPSVVVAARDRRAPRATLALARTTLQKVVKRGYVPVNVRCDEASAINLRVVVSRKLRRGLGANPIATRKGNCRPGKTAKLKPKLKRKARKGLRRRKALSVTLKATAIDAAGNRATASKRGKIKRKRER
jgi:hypothetical protein